jgi:hypothetical protein
MNKGANFVLIPSVLGLRSRKPVAYVGKLSCHDFGQSCWVLTSDCKVRIIRKQYHC